MALTITEMLRKHGVVGKFVEFYGPGVVSVPMANRTTIGNMSPEYGSTCAIFPIDEETLRYLRLTGRSDSQVELVEKYAKAQGMWHDPAVSPRFSEHIELDLSTVVPSISGPKRPQDRISLSSSKGAFEKILPTYITDKTGTDSYPVNVGAKATTIKNGDVVIASITSCTNTSNPSVMIGAALLAKKAVERGLTSKPWVKTTLAPGSKVVTDYYDRADLTKYMDALGFNLVGYGCVTCIGNSGPLPIEISKSVNEHDLAVTAVLSGNRNFEGRISPDVKMNYLASPPLVVAYALAGTMNHDFVKDALGKDKDGKDVFLADIWPSAQEIQSVIDSSISSEMFKKDYATVFDGDHRWKSLDTPTGKTFDWDAKSTYVRKPPYFDGMPANPKPVTDITGARVLAILGDSVTTDHISPAGNIKADSPAGKYLEAHGVARGDFNSYGSRRGNHEVMIRGTFANIRLKNMLLDGVEGGFTRNFLSNGEQTTIYDASIAYQNAGVPLVILAGKEYGSGSSRDWAAKGTALLGVRAVIAESFERIHRSNLIGMGVLPLQFKDGQTAQSLGLDGTETFAISGITEMNKGGIPKEVKVTAGDKSFTAKVRIDTPGEGDYYRHGGIMQYVLRQLLQ
jgi:aconitate hydratase